MNGLRSSHAISGTLIYGILLTDKEVKDQWLNEAMKHPYYDDHLPGIGDYIIGDLRGYSLVAWGCCYYTEHQKLGNPVFALGINLGLLEDSIVNQESFKYPDMKEIEKLENFLRKDNHMFHRIGMYIVPTGCYTCT